MKKFLLTTAALVLLATTAQAEIRTLYSGKSWSTWYMPQNNEGDQMCGMTANFSDAGASRGAIFVKFTVEGGVFMQVFKSNWSIAEGTEVPMAVTFVDNAKPDYSLSLSTDTARASKNPVNGASVRMNVKSEDVQTFLNVFGDADKLTVSFPQGDELPWTSKMEGSRMAAKWFAACRLNVIRTASAVTQPVKPTGPAQPTGNARVKDDGSI